MTPEELQERTLVSSVASNYRAACLARSHKEWTAKIGVVREEADETVLWLVFIERAGIADDRRTEADSMTDEARQLVRIFAASYRTGQDR